MQEKTPPRAQAGLVGGNKYIGISSVVILVCVRDDKPEYEISPDTGDATGYHGKDEGKAEPKYADTVKLCQSAANTCDDAITL
jgi:hypothetical protein